jgi:hypothetical protein
MGRLSGLVAELLADLLRNPTAVLFFWPDSASSGSGCKGKGRQADPNATYIISYATAVLRAGRVWGAAWLISSII